MVNVPSAAAAHAAFAAPKGRPLARRCPGPGGVSSPPGRRTHTDIDQVFLNPQPRDVEGTYIFPIPEGAQIDKFRMDVNGKMTTAELLDAKKARSIYEEIVRRAKDPALMEYSSQGMFKVRIFPIEPHKEKRIKIKYTQLLKRDGRITEYTYPLNTEKFSSRPIKSVSVKVDIEYCSQGPRPLCPILTLLLKHIDEM